MREITFAKGFETEVETSFDALSPRGLVGVDFLWEELERFLPDLPRLCGRIGAHERFAVYAQPIPDETGHCLVTCFDTQEPQPWPCEIHGQIQSDSPSQDALALVAGRLAGSRPT